MEKIFDIGVSSEGAKYKALEEYFKEENIDMKSEVSRSDIECILQLMIIDEILKKDFSLNLELDKNVIKPFLRLMLSNARKSRKEMVEVFKEPSVETQKGRMRTLLGI